jgi:hypothetical protein
VAGGDAFVRERFGHRGNELQHGKTSIDVACALAGLLDHCGYVVAGNAEQLLEDGTFADRSPPALRI